MVFLCAVNYLTIEKKYENQLLAIFFAKMQQHRRTRSKCRKSRETAYYVLEKRRRFLFWQTGSSKTLLHIRKRLQKCIVVENWNEISNRSMEGQTLMLKGRDAIISSVWIEIGILCFISKVINQKWNNLDISSSNSASIEFS